MKKSLLLIVALLACLSAWAQNDSDLKREILKLSAQKWQMMSDKDVAGLADLFHSTAMFTHMGGSWGKEQELDIIKKGFIWYKHADIHSADVKIAGQTAMVYSDMHLTAVVGETQQAVINHFITTEAFANVDGKWVLVTLAFTKLVEPQN